MRGVKDVSPQRARADRDTVRSRQLSREAAALDPDYSLGLRAVWLHYAGGLTQAAVGQRLGITSVKTHRLIARALADGVLKVSIDGDIIECLELERRLADRFGLSFCEIAPDLGEAGLPLRALGIAGASYLRRETEGGRRRVIGLGHGRTLAAAVHELPRFDAGGVRFVSLLGGVTRNYIANPYDVMHRLTQQTSAQAFVMPVPFFANSAEDREVLLNQRGVRDVFEMAEMADLKIAGIGSVDRAAQLVSSGMIEPQEIEEIAQAGGKGELLGHFFDANGQLLETTLSDRTLSVSLPDADAGRVVAIAGGADKVGAIGAILRSGRLSGIITDETTATALLDEPEVAGH